MVVDEALRNLDFPQSVFTRWWKPSEGLEPGIKLFQGILQEIQIQVDEHPLHYTSYFFRYLLMKRNRGKAQAPVEVGSKNPICKEFLHILLWVVSRMSPTASVFSPTSDNSSKPGRIRHG